MGMTFSNSCWCRSGWWMTDHEDLERERRNHPSRSTDFVQRWICRVTQTMTWDGAEEGDVKSRVFYVNILFGNFRQSLHTLRRSRNSVQWFPEGVWRGEPPKSLCSERRFVRHPDWVTLDCNCSSINKCFGETFIGSVYLEFQRGWRRDCSFPCVAFSARSEERETRTGLRTEGRLCTTGPDLLSNFLRTYRRDHRRIHIDPPGLRVDPVNSVPNLHSLVVPQVSIDFR